MYFIAAFGLLMMCFSLTMIVSPNRWSNGIIRFSEKSYFHWFEVITRLFTGLVFVVYSQAALYPPAILGLGYLLIAVAIGLVIVGPTNHRNFAVWSAVKFRAYFRLAGAGGVTLASWLIYLSTSVLLVNP